MIKTLETMNEICKGICSKPVSQSSPMSTRISAVDNSPERNENVEDDSVSIIGGNVVFMGSGDASDGGERVRMTEDSENWSVLKERDEDEGFDLFKEAQESVKEVERDGGEKNWATTDGYEPLDLDNEWEEDGVVKEKGEVDDVKDIEGHEGMGLFGSAMKMFDEMPLRDVPGRNAVLPCYSHDGQWEKVWGLFERMKGFGFSPDSVCYTNAISSCARLLDVKKGKDIHYEMLSIRSPLDSFIGGAHVDMYEKFYEKFCVNCENSMTTTCVFDVSSEKKYDKVLNYKLRDNEHGEYLMKWRYKERDKDRYGENRSTVGTSQLAKPELCHAYDGMVHRVVEIDEWPVEEKKVIMVILVGAPGNGVGAPGNGKSTFYQDVIKISNLPWIRVCHDTTGNGKAETKMQCLTSAATALKKGEGEMMRCKLHEDERGKVLTCVCGSYYYYFANIIPEKHNIHAVYHDLPIEVHDPTEVKLGFGNTGSDVIFSFHGCDIHGLVIVRRIPLLGVHIYLYSDVLKVNCPQGFGDPPGESKVFCHTILDANVVFKFKCIPCGVYNLIPYYNDEDTIFDVSPPFWFVSVQHEHATIPPKFHVTGFSVGGSIVDGNNIGVGVKIIVDGQEKLITDKGLYKFDQATPKYYAIEAKKKHYKFDKLHDFMVLPNMVSVVDIKAIPYDVCGLVDTVSHWYKAKVSLTQGQENVEPQVKQTDGNGNFCFEVLTGEYRLSSFSAKPESAPELLLLPPYVEVNVNRTLLTIRFHQAQVNVIGSVMCKENCGSSVYVTIVRMGGSRKKEWKSVSLTDQNSEFLFSNILPGKYRFEVKRQFPGLQEDNLVWNQKSFDVDVGTEDVKEKGDTYGSWETHIYVVACFCVISDDIKMVKLNDGGAYDFLYLMCNSSELKIFCAKIYNLDWALDYDVTLEETNKHSVHLALLLWDEEPPRPGNENSGSGGILKFEQVIENVNWKQVDKTKKIENVEQKRFDCGGREDRKLFIPATMVLHSMSCSIETRTIKGECTELATDFEDGCTMHNLEPDASRGWYLSSSDMHALVQAKYTGSYNYILEDKDVLKEKVLSRFELIVMNYLGGNT